MLTWFERAQAIDPARLSGLAAAARHFISKRTRTKFALPGESTHGSRSAGVA
jgi:hypothetical protein